MDKLIPSPDFSRHGSPPPSVAPATNTFSYTGAPSPSTGRSEESTAMPATFIAWRAKYSGSKRCSPRAGTPATGRPSAVSRASQCELNSSPPLANPPVASTTQSARWTSSRSPTRTRSDSTRAPEATQPTTTLLSRTVPRAARSAVVKTACSRIPGTEGGSVGTSNTGRPSRSSSDAQTACGEAIPSTAGNATRSPSRSCPASALNTRSRNAASSNARA